ncbi:4Fe-4S ferredoxin, iron-sulfur binding domain protein [Candidatus Vecturithrix granuli]|uniref:4Fe-4S ferredoxin, iron-sulfur binding domain protein n=1 Tax=Vecturithrix granuli TaxID=1499967 RepID=A0A081CA25_VECG1|nr:4Fe-4S ferredoxin, iron-sulfur binding domain protein [Candidatus Vecturithrix granuli]
MNQNESAVYFLAVPDGADVGRQAAAMKKLYKASQAADIIQKEDMVAIKVHVGEQHNTTHVRSELIKEIVNKVKGKGGQPFLTETSTLYRGQRENAIKHLLHAYQHGFSIETLGAPFIMADGLAGNTEHEVQIDAELHERVNVAREILVADALIAVSHPTGHPGSGLGACIKNLGMGLASRMGKMRQHSAMKPEVKPDKCTFCRKCMRWCPEDAIIERESKAFIVQEKCIGCGECIAVCRFGAVSFDFASESAFLQKSMAEHAYGVVKDKPGKCFYFNVLIDMTKGCDCYSTKQEKCIPDIGILASCDPVAIDMATLDLTTRANGQSLAEISAPHLNALIQLQHAEKIGMGSMKYQLIEI